MNLKSATVPKHNILRFNQSFVSVIVQFLHRAHCLSISAATPASCACPNFLIGKYRHAHLSRDPPLLFVRLFRRTYQFVLFALTPLRPLKPSFTQPCLSIGKNSNLYRIVTTTAVIPIQVLAQDGISSPPRRSGRTRTAPKLFLDLYPPPASPTRKSPEAKTNVPSRDSEQQEREQQPAQQPVPENSACLSDPPETNPLPRIRFFSKGEKRKAGSDEDRLDAAHAGPSSVPFDIGDSRPSKQRIIERTPSVIYPSIEIHLGTEAAEAGAVPRQMSGSVYGDENKENIPPASELSTIILSSDQSEHGWRGSRGRSRGPDRSESEHEERLRSASYERGRRLRPDDIRLEQAERRGSENSYKIDVIRTQVATNEERSAQLEARINALYGTTNISTTVYQQQSRELQRLTARVDALEQNMPTRKPAPAPSTVPMDARILTRLQEIQKTDPGTPNFQKLVDDFYEHFGINWRHLESRYRECNYKMPNAVCGVYYLRAKAKLQLEGHTEKQRDADENIVLASDAITGIWLATKERDGELESLLAKEFAELFMKVCETETISPDEPSQQDAQPAPRRGRR